VTRRILVAPDKFRGSVTAKGVVEAVRTAVEPIGFLVDGAPMADGGEGTLDVVEGVRRTSVVTGPLGEPVAAQWVSKGDVAVIEMAQASGLLLAGGPEGNDPLAATTQGTGELIDAAVRSGAMEVVVGMGGSASTDGGLGCVKALWPHARLREVELVVAADVRTLFIEAARMFGPQKGATPSQVQLLERRLHRVADEYKAQFGIDVRQLPGSGAAGGLAGGLAAIGAQIVRGFEYLAELVDLDARMEAADLVVTGEGALDEHSFDGKVVGGVLEMANAAGIPVLVIVGEVQLADVDRRIGGLVDVVSLVDEFGTERALRDAPGCITAIAGGYLARMR
jgi:glycerate kinase